MSDKFDRLVSLLRELFQLDQPDLDFGLYRIMHAKSGEVTQFLEKDLLPQVKKAFEQYQPADKAAIKKKLDQAVAAAESLGVDPDTNEKVLQLRAELAEGADLESMENDVYDHLYSFFRRYYSEGDFLAKRVYKPGVYAVPYEGEEVVLHWANKDQYYIKTSEYLRDYAFRLKPDAGDAWADPKRVHFRLAAAAEGEHGVNKAAEGKDRVFVLAPAGESGHDFLSVETVDGREELVIGFEYRPATMEDWTDEAKAQATAAAKKKPPKQKDLINIAVKAVLATTGEPFGGWISELAKLHTKVNGETAEYSRLQGHLNRYCARHTFDYFIHKDLGRFLRRELDFYIKNEVMHLDDIQNEDAPKVEQYLSKIKVIRTIAGKVIDFLHQLEEFQKKLWLKKKFVTETFYCIRLGVIPEEFYAEIAANQAQHDEWVELCAINKIKGDLTTPGYSKKLKVEFLKAQPTLMVDTRHFEPAFVARLMEAMGDLDAQTDGVLVNSENLQALRLMQARYGEQAKCIYIDPPYNTGSDDFVYKDGYPRSTWGAMIRDRLEAGLAFASQDAGFFVSIDENEQPNLRQYMNLVFGESNFVADMVWAAGRKNDSRLVSVSHEYIVAYARDREHLKANKTEWRQRKKGLDDIYARYEKLKKQHGTDYAQMTLGMKKWYKSLPDSHPAKAHKHYCHVDKRGIYFPDNISWPGGGGPKYKVLHPTTGKPVKTPARGWMTADEDKMKQWIKDDLVHFGEDETSVPCIKSYLKDREYQAPYSVFYKDGRAATKRLRQILGSDDFGYPKDETVIAEIVQMLTSADDLVLDYFAGSGTTAHAVINQNREDGVPRRFILVEMGSYFDRVVVKRCKRIVFTPEWKKGQPTRPATQEEADRSPRIFKCVRLEGYEDSLGNLQLDRTADHESVFASPASAGLAEQYMLQYMLGTESRGSMSLLNIQAFVDPTGYTLKVKAPGSDDSRDLAVDLPETFNWLLGLRVGGVSAPKSFTANFTRDKEGRLRVKGRVKEAPDGPWWFRTVTGTTPDGKRALIIWRKRPGGDEPEGIEQDNAVLDAWFRTQGYSTTDSEFDIVWVNGDNNLANLRQDDTPDDGLGETGWKVRIIEQDFHRLMFDTSDVPGGA